MSDYLKRVEQQAETDARDADVTANVVVCGGPPGETVSMHAALGARAGVWRWCVLCRLLEWLVQRGHCEKTLDPNYVMPWWVYVRAALAFAAVTALAVGGVAWAAWALF
jgi:hypothetical protein